MLTPRGRNRGCLAAGLLLLLSASLLVGLAQSAVLNKDSRTVLISIEVPKTAEGVARPVFELKEGDRISDAVSSFALSTSLSADEEAQLLSAVNAQAVALRLLPITTLTVPGSGGAADAKIAIFEGDSIRDKVLQAASGAGITDPVAIEGLLQDAIRSLKRERVVPVMSLNVTVPGTGQVQVLSMFQGDTEEQVTKAFAAQHGLDEPQAASLLQTVNERALIHGVRPLLEIPGPAEEAFQLFHGEQLGAAVAKYIERNRLGEDAKADLTSKAGREATLAGLLPYAAVDVQLPAKQAGEDAKTVTLRARIGENATDIVKAFADEHGLPASDSTQILRAILRQGTEGRFLPALEFPVTLEGAGAEEMFKLYQGDEAANVVAAFAAKHGVNKEEEALLLDHATKLAKSARLMPLAILSVNVTEPSGEDGKLGRTVPVSFPVYEGEAVAAQAEAAARSVDGNLPESVIKGIVEAAVAEGRRNRLEALAVFNVTLGREEFRIPAFMGDNITDICVAFAKEKKLSDEEAEDMLAQVTMVAMQQKLLPMISVPVRITLEDTGNVTTYVMEVFHGENIEEAVDKFLKGLDSVQPEELARAKESMLRLSTQKAYEGGLLPILSVPTQVGGAEANVKVFKGDSPQEAVDRFVRRTPGADSLSSEDSAALVAKVEEAAKGERLLPVLQLELVAGDRRVPLMLFQGDNITQKMEAMSGELKLAPEDRRALEASVVSKAQARRLLPTLQLPVELGEGVVDSFALFEGDDIKAAVTAWGESHGLSGEQVAVLESGVTARATQARLVPAVKLDVKVGGVPQELLLYTGDNITDAVQSFVLRHGLNSDDSKVLNAAVQEKAVTQRMVPEHVIPIEIEGQQGSESILLFKGDSIEDRVEEFVAKHKDLDIKKGMLVESIRKFIEHKAGAGAASEQQGGSARKDEL